MPCRWLTVWLLHGPGCSSCLPGFGCRLRMACAGWRLGRGAVLGRLGSGWRTKSHPGWIGEIDGRGLAIRSRPLNRFVSPWQDLCRTRRWAGHSWIRFANAPEIPHLRGTKPGWRFPRLEFLRSKAHGGGAQGYSVGLPMLGLLQDTSGGLPGRQVDILRQRWDWRRCPLTERLGLGVT